MNKIQYIKLTFASLTLLMKENMNSYLQLRIRMKTWFMLIG